MACAYCSILIAISDLIPILIAISQVAAIFIAIIQYVAIDIYCKNCNRNNFFPGSGREGVVQSAIFDHLTSFDHLKQFLDL